MSSKTVMICDRCGKEFSEDNEHVKLFTYYLSYEESKSSIDPKRHDLCADCALKFAAFMAEPSVAEARKMDPFWITDDRAVGIIRELFL